MLVFAASAGLGVLPAYDRSLTSAALTAVLVSVALYFVVAYLIRSWLTIRLASGIVLLIATLLALYFITQFGHQNYPEIQGFVRRLGEVTTLPLRLGDYTFHPNSIATFLETALPLGVARMISSRSFERKLFWGMCVLVILYAFFLTVSYRAWLALAATALLAVGVVLLVRLPRVITIPIVGIGVISLVAVLALGPERLPFPIPSSLSDLARQFQNNLYLAQDYMFTGIGLGDTYAMVYSRYSLLIYVPFLTYPNNLPLAVWFNQGLLGLLAFGGIIVSFYLLVARVIRAAAPRRLFHGAWLGVTATLLHGLLDSRQYADQRWVMPMLFVAIGLTVATGRLAVEEIETYDEPQSVDWRRWIAIAAAVIVVVGAGIARFNRPLMAAWYTNLGAVDEARGELPDNLPDSLRQTYYNTAEAWYRRALEIEPNYPNTNRRLGNLLVKLDQFEAAVPLLETAFAGEPTNPATIKGLGLAYVWVGRTEDAARTFALHDDPNGIAGELSAWGYFRSDQGRPLLAARAWETAQLMDPDSVNVGVWLLIADTFRSADDLDSARRWYARVLEVEPGNQPALDALAQMG